MTESEQKLVSDWADYTIAAWEKRIKKQKIGVSNELVASFLKELSLLSNGGIDKVQFLFLFYGRFVDMGVGKGTKIGQVKELSLSRRLGGRNSVASRRRKPWYSKVMQKEVGTLAVLLRKEYSKEINGTLREGFLILNKENTPTSK